MPLQEAVPCNGYAIQCRITTEDPENKFVPDYGRIIAYRSPGGLGIRLDGGMGFAGAVITPFYDSLLVKLISSGQSYQLAMQRTRRALSEFRIRGVKTNIPFLDNVIAHPIFRAGAATTTLIDTTPELFAFKPRRDRATKILNFIGNVTINRNPHLKGYRPGTPLPEVGPPAYNHKVAPPDGTRQRLLKLGAKKFADWTAAQKRLLVTDTTFRDAHQSLMATRVRTYDMLACAGHLAHEVSGLYSLD